MFRITPLILAIIYCLVMQIPFCCENGGIECDNTGNSYEKHVSPSYPHQSTGTLLLSLDTSRQVNIQQSIVGDFNCPCSCCHSPFICRKTWQGIASEARVKPTNLKKRWHSKISIVQNSLPTFPFEVDSHQGSAAISTIARCSLMSRFLL